MKNTTKTISRHTTIQEICESIKLENLLIFLNQTLGVSGKLVVSGIINEIGKQPFDKQNVRIKLSDNTGKNSYIFPFWIDKRCIWLNDNEKKELHEGMNVVVTGSLQAWTSKNSFTVGFSFNVETIQSILNERSPNDMTLTPEEIACIKQVENLTLKEKIIHLEQLIEQKDKQLTAIQRSLENPEDL